MKKITLVTALLATAIAAMAQTQTVKEIERTLNAKPIEYPKHIANLRATFDNPETANQAYTYYVAGNSAYKFFDQAQALISMGQNVDRKAMGHAAIDAYNYLLKALSLDTITDAKGKVKTKYSKDIIKNINAHYNDFNNAAVELWGVQDYQGAYDAWELVFQAPVEPSLGANAPAAIPDSIGNVIAFNQGLAAYNLEDWDKTLASFDRSIALGNKSKTVYDYAIGAAYRLPEDQRAAIMAHYAELAYPLFGQEDNSYIGYMINEKIQAGQYDQARTMIDKYIAADPTNAHLYYILGVLLETKENDAEAEAEALTQFEKCVQLDANHAQAYLQLGYLTYRKAEKADEAAQSLDVAAYNKNRSEVVDPILRQAAEYLEKSYQLDPENSRSALANLRSIYYNLNDAANLERIENLSNN